MKCNNATVEFINDRYRVTLPEDKQKEKDEVLREAVAKYNGYVHIEISRVRRPKSVEANALFHALITEYYLSGQHECKTWQELKNLMKYRYGAGFLHTIKLPDGHDYGILKSVSEYNTAELSGMIDGVIREMLIIDIKSKKFTEILEEIHYEIK